MDIVERIKVEKWTNRDGEDVTSYRVTLVNEIGQREVNCYDPRGKDLKEDTPLPEGWEVKTSKAGKPYLAAPRNSAPGGGRSNPLQTAWRNTEAGAKYEQERMDRRTALMQAVTAHPSEETPDAPVYNPEILGTADMFYAWLRQTVDGGGGQSNSPTHREAAPPSSVKRSPNQPPAGWDEPYPDIPPR
jgi:hypothetical protein